MDDSRVLKSLVDQRTVFEQDSSLNTIHNVKQISSSTSSLIKGFLYKQCRRLHNAAFVAALSSISTRLDMPGSAILTNGIQRPAADDADGRQGYTSRFDIPYGLSTLQTLDLHIRSSPLVNPPGYWIVYVPSLRFFPVKHFR